MRFLLTATVASAVYLTCVPAGAANLVVNGGFESGAPVIGSRPTTFGQWRGDRVGYTHAENGIAPPEGTTMLRFFNTSGGSPSGTSDTSQYWQNIDLSSFASAISTGNARLSASAVFNRIAGNAQTDTEMGLQVFARSGSPSLFTELASAGNSILSDSDPNSWELVALSNFILPPGTTFVQFELDAYENNFNNASNPEFDGHYADDVIVTLTVVPEPDGSALCAVGTALILLAGRRAVRRDACPVKVHEELSEHWDGTQR